MNKIYIGIDVGTKGGIAILDQDGKSVFVSKMPMIAKEYDLQTIKEILNIMKDTYDSLIVGIEDVHAIQGNIGNSSNFTFGLGKGVLMGMVAGMSIPYVLVQPKQWQKVSWEGVKKMTLPTKRALKGGGFAQKTDTKSTSLVACKRLFPYIEEVCPPLKFYADTQANRHLCRANIPLKKQPVPHDGIVDALLIANYLVKTQ
jgi:hypothetical protein